MKKEFPFYKGYRNGKRVNQSLLVEKKLKQSDKKLIDDFLFFHSINSKAEKRKENWKRVMLQFYDFLEKDLMKINDNDFLNFAEAISRSERTINGKNDVKIVVKSFGKWLEENKEKKFPSLKLIKFEQAQGSNKINSHIDLLTELEFDKMMRATSNIMHKTLICLLWESAARPEEALKLRYVDIDFTKKTIKLHSSKTKKFRVVPIDLTIKHLERLREESNIVEEDFVFVSQNQKKQMGNAGLNSILKTIQKRAGIKKYISSYTYRHTRLSFLIKKLSPKAYENISGHSLEMGMKTYAHLSVDDLTDEMKEKVFSVKELTEDDKEKYDKKIKLLEKDIKKIKEFEETLTWFNDAKLGLKKIHLGNGLVITKK
jgi:integrase|tara:strand:+ start:1420 stop:2535 length:1116 start_codon:yes stop_codon:yes gene_type:complete